MENILLDYSDLDDHFQEHVVLGPVLKGQPVSEIMDWQKFTTANDMRKGRDTLTLIFVKNSYDEVYTKMVQDTSPGKQEGQYISDIVFDVIDIQYRDGKFQGSVTYMRTFIRASKWSYRENKCRLSCDGVVKEYGKSYAVLGLSETLGTVAPSYFKDSIHGSLYKNIIYRESIESILYGSHKDCVRLFQDRLPDNTSMCILNVERSFDYAGFQRNMTNESQFENVRCCRKYYSALLVLRCGDSYKILEYPMALLTYRSPMRPEQNNLLEVLPLQSPNVFDLYIYRDEGRFFPSNLYFELFENCTPPENSCDDSTKVNGPGLPCVEINFSCKIMGRDWWNCERCTTRRNYYSFILRNASGGYYFSC